jgi:hypothetical protein
LLIGRFVLFYPTTLLFTGLAIVAAYQQLR